jgi:hypothetical protein
MRIKDVAKIVHKVLREEKQTRNDDDLLYLRVCNRIAGEVSGMTVATFLLHRRELGLPCMESCRRARQKIQAAFPELRPDDDTANYRLLEEERYKAFSRGFTV